MTLPFEKLKSEFNRVLLSLGFGEKEADQCATIFASNSRDGVHSHGLNRFPTVVQYIKDGLIKPDAVPTKEGGFGAMEQWDGNLGPGILNAIFCMDRAATIGLILHISIAENISQTE